MNDKDVVIKGLECCRHSFCCDCPYEKYSENCTDKLITEAYHLVKRQQAEIKSLKEHEENISIVCERAEEKYHELYKEAKEILRRDTIKEFAKKLKNLIYSQLGISTYEKGEAFHFCLDEIDNLVKIIAGGESDD